ncbi:MAG TPA: type II toxin-antitoxin system RelE/ParE family toxin [Gemmataceae bacterium]|nr:type II toxin-antitoxin system RelE/ParE family toxin [Gemmataceae bacterium]
MSEEAEADVREGYQFYERRRTGLGEVFLDSIDACLHAICRVPKARTFFLEDFRRALVRKFPYAVYYTYDETEHKVVVYCVFHSKRDPQALRERLS